MTLKSSFFDFLFYNGNISYIVLNEIRFALQSEWSYSLKNSINNALNALVCSPKHVSSYCLGTPMLRISLVALADCQRSDIRSENVTLIHSEEYT